MATAQLPGEIVAAHGRQYLVETGAGELVRCVTRGKRSDLACGDRVMFQSTAAGEGVIESQIARQHLLRRAAAHREKLIAANITQVAIVVALEPSFSDELIARVIVAAERESIRSLIVLNKIDIPDTLRARERLEPFRAAGYPIVEIAATVDVEPLATRLRHERTALVGQSGMGKSTIVNALFPEANLATGEISRFLASGRHTTTAARLFRFAGGRANDGSAHADDAGSVIDSPGVQAFGLAHLARAEIEHGFVELGPYLGHCKFADCRHQTEPECAIRAAAAAHAIHPRRLELLGRILEHAAA